MPSKPTNPNEPASVNQPTIPIKPANPLNPLILKERAIITETTLAGKLPPRALLRAAVRSAYDLQMLRIAAGLRLVAHFKSKLGQAPSTPEKELDSKAKELLEVLRLSYTRLTDGVTERKTSKIEFGGEDLISSHAELILVRQYLNLLSGEVEQFKDIGRILNEFPIFTKYLDGVKGIGPAIAGVIISSFDITKAHYPSSLWAYAGLDVAADGRGRGRYKDHLRDYEYVDKNGDEATRKGLTFNPWLKTKLLGVVAPSFLKCQSPWSKVYYDYKNRLENRKVPEGEEPWSKLHIHRASLRYMVKMFLIELYEVWREMEGLEVMSSYQEAKLGHVHGLKG